MDIEHFDEVIMQQLRESMAECKGQGGDFKKWISVKRNYGLINMSAEALEAEFGRV